MKTEKSVMPGTLVLASGSPRRKQLLAAAGYKFAVVPPTVDEPAQLPASRDPLQFAQALAYFKAANISRENPNSIVLGADTVVEVNGKILGKPVDADHARAMLRELSHNRHRVITGVAIIDRVGRRRIITADTTWITMVPMSDAQIEEYIESGEWEGKAGAYGIQGTADRFVKTVEGSWSNVVGLPMELVERLMRGMFDID